MRHSIPGGHSTTAGTRELKAVAREAWEVGTHALHAAGNWLDNMRASRMKDRNQDNQGQGRAQAQGGHRNGSRPDGRQAYYGPQGQGYGGPAPADPRGDFGQRHAPWREQGLGSGDYPYDEYGHRAEARRGGYGMDEAERAYGREQERGSGFGSSQQYEDMRGPGGTGASGYRGAGGDQAYGQAQDRGYAQQGHVYGREYGHVSSQQGGSMYSGQKGGYWGQQQSGQGHSFQSRRGLGPRSYTRTDERIREDLNERLMDDDFVDARDITVEVQNGTVSLSGSVDERWEKHRAEDIADACGGVREVRNNIRIASSDSSSASQSDLRASSSSTTNGNKSAGASKSSGTGSGSGTLS